MRHRQGPAGLTVKNSEKTSRKDRNEQKEQKVMNPTTSNGRMACSLCSGFTAFRHFSVSFDQNSQFCQFRSLTIRAAGTLRVDKSDYS